MQAPMSSTISGELLARLAQQGDVKAYAKNEILITEGDISDALFILLTGQLKVFTRDSKGREIVYNMLEPGELFGEMFLDGGTRSASVKAMVKSQCVLIEEAQIRQLIASYPEFAESMIQILISRLRNSTRMIKSLVLNDVYERTIALLNEVAHTEGAQRVVPASFTQQEMAGRVGATREMINHVIAELMKGGFLSRDEDRRLVFKKALPSRW